MAITAHLVSDATELWQVYRLRYEVYIEELGNRHPLADAERRMLRDAMDDAAPIVIGAYDNAALVGTLRLNAIADCPREALTFHQIPEGYFMEGRRRFVASMLIVERRYRSSSVILYLCREAARRCRERGIISLHLFGESHNVKLYERMGFSVRWDQPMRHPIYREVYPAEIDDSRHRNGAFYHRVLKAKPQHAAEA